MGQCGEPRSPIVMDSHCEQLSKKVVKCDSQNFAAIPIITASFIDRRDGIKKTMKGVSTLDFSNNTISDLSGLPLACKLMRGKIDVLNLENNNVSELFASNFESCNMIKKIILSGNPIRTFDPLIFKNMKRLGNIQIDAGNEDAEEGDDTICWSTKDLLAFTQMSKKLKMTMKLT